MSVLVITHQQKSLGFSLPYQIFINGSLVGLMTTPQIQIRLPEDTYTVTICAGAVLPIGKSGKQLDLRLSSSLMVRTSAKAYTCIDFKNKERWWDVIFSIDLILWIVLLFFTLPKPWNIVYHILSDGFFLVWLVRLIVLRKRYFTLSSYQMSDLAKKIQPQKQKKSSVLGKVPAISLAMLV